MDWFKIEFQKTSNFIGNGNINFYTNLFYRLCQPASHKIEIKLLFWELILLHQKYWHVTSSEKENFSTFFEKSRYEMSILKKKNKPIPPISWFSLSYAQFSFSTSYVDGFQKFFIISRYFSFPFEHITKSTLFVYNEYKMNHRREKERK